MHVHGARAAGRAPRSGGGDTGLIARPATPSEEAAWDGLAIASGRPQLLQSRGWALAKGLTGWSARRYVLGEGRLAQVLVKRLLLGISVAYCPRGPLVPDDELAGAVAAVRDALSAERCAALLCDPEVPSAPGVLPALRAAGIAPAPVFVQPRRTLLVDASREPDDLLGEMRRKTRQYIRKAERAGVATEETADLARFHRLLRRVGEREGFAVRSLEYLGRLRDGLGESLHVLMASVGGEDVGGLMLGRMGDRAWELYGGWGGTHGEDRPFYLLKWRALLRMRQLGVRRYDMWGLAERPDDPADPLAGVEEFKLGFGGTVAEWTGALETPVTRWLYPLWQLAGRRRLARAAA